MKWKHYSYEDANVKVRDNYGKVTYYDDDFEKIESTFEEKDLKTPSSYRNIPLQKWLNNMMYAYMLYIMEQKGYTSKEQLDDEYIFMNSLGHALASTTMDYYVEYDEDTNKAEIEKLGQVNNIQIVPEFLK